MISAELEWVIKLIEVMVVLGIITLLIVLRKGQKKQEEFWVEEVKKRIKRP
jgi:amino acid permease